MKCMDKLPRVNTCCICCFLRAGTVMIALFSFLVGLIFLPNVCQTPGFWDLDSVLSSYNTATETAIQMLIGYISVLLCFVSVLLFIGALCNVPVIIEMYQWGALVYSGVVIFLFIILALCCFFIHTNCFVAGIVLCGLVACNILLTAYFVIVTNSLRISLKYIPSKDLVY